MICKKNTKLIWTVSSVTICKKFRPLKGGAVSNFFSTI